MKKFFKIPIVRHILAAFVIVTSLYYSAIMPLQEVNTDLQKRLTEITKNQNDLILKLGQKDTYKIENKVEGAKIKKGGAIHLTPRSDLEVKNETNLLPEEKEETPPDEPEIKKKSFWRKIFK